MSDRMAETLAALTGSVECLTGGQGPCVKFFPVELVLTAISGVKVTTDMAGYWSLLEWVFGPFNFDQALPDKCRRLQQWVGGQYSELAKVNTAGVNAENLQAFVAGLAARFGAELPVRAFDL